MKQSGEIKHVTDRLFDALQDVEVEIALGALARVTEEFSRAAKDEIGIQKSLGTPYDNWHEGRIGTHLENCVTQIR
jgi:hypothetical protein